MGDILSAIAEHTRGRVRKAKALRPLKEIKEALNRNEQNESCKFEKALRTEGLSLICECKRASPSKGLIAKEFPYIEIAKEYEAGGAAAISCLTEPRWFLGKDEYLRGISEAVSIPVLRKDFTIDSYQLYEARLLGASAVLLICSILSERELKEYIKISAELGLSALVEVHDKEELDMALRSGAAVIGVNNRNLRDFTVNFENCLRLRELVPDEVLFVAESGIETGEQLAELRRNRVNAALIGERLMRADNRSEAVRSMLGAANS